MVQGMGLDPIFIFMKVKSHLGKNCWCFCNLRKFNTLSVCTPCKLKMFDRDDPLVFYSYVSSCYTGPGRIASGCPKAYEKPLEIGFVLSDGEYRSK